MPTLSPAERRARVDDDRHAVARSQVFYNYSFPIVTLAVGIITVVPTVIFLQKIGSGGGWSPRELKGFQKADAKAFRLTKPADVVAEAEATVLRASRRGSQIAIRDTRKGLYDDRR